MIAGIVNPFGIDVLFNDLYWISLGNDQLATVYKMDKYLRGVNVSIASGFQIRPEDVGVYHSAKYPLRKLIAVGYYLPSDDNVCW